MATRKFELPGIQDLTKEQERVRALPKQGQHLIVGGPGTGKSVMALIRSRRLAQDKADYCFLVYTHLLHRASLQLFGNARSSRTRFWPRRRQRGHSLSGQTWHTWFRELFQEVVGHRVPRLPPSQGSSFRDIDWKAVQQMVDDLPAPANMDKPFLVIDEGQDMPPAFYEVLVKLGFEDFFVACDQNQQITDSNSSRQDIQDCLGLEPQEVIELAYNHRNTYPVARLAREFYTGDPASPPPELPRQPSRIQVPTLYTYDDTDAVAERILRWLDREPSRLIGVIAPNNRIRERYYTALKSAAEATSRDNESPPIETFYSQHRPEVSFGQGGILVINAQACKGLEFDDVMLADINRHYANDPDMARKRFYVMVSRAREYVFMFQPAGESSSVETILPTDRSILKRRTL